MNATCAIFLKMLLSIGKSITKFAWTSQCVDERTVSQQDRASSYWGKQSSSAHTLSNHLTSTTIVKTTTGNVYIWALSWELICISPCCAAASPARRIVSLVFPLLFISSRAAAESLAGVVVVAWVVDTLVRPCEGRRGRAVVVVVWAGLAVVCGEPLSGTPRVSRAHHVLLLTGRWVVICQRRRVVLATRRTRVAAHMGGGCRVVRGGKAGTHPATIAGASGRDAAGTRFTLRFTGPGHVARRRGTGRLPASVELLALDLLVGGSRRVVAFAWGCTVYTLPSCQVTQGLSGGEFLACLIVLWNRNTSLVKLW